MSVRPTNVSCGASKRYVGDGLVDWWGIATQTQPNPTLTTLNYHPTTSQARQCAIDPFWGLPTEWERLRRLEEERRRIWEARIGDRRTRMVQIGEAKSDTKDETEHIRNCRQGDYFGPVDTFGRLIDPHTGKPGAFPDENPMLRM